MKKGFLKTLASVVVLALMLSVSVSAFAAASLPITSVNTAVSGDNATVTAGISGVDADEQVTVQVTKDSNILYMDQKGSLAGGGVTFTFTDAAETLNGATVKFGTTSYAATTQLADQTISTVTTPTNKTITYSATNGYVIAVADTGSLTDASELAVPNNATVTATDAVTFYLYPAAGYTAAGMEVDGVTVIANSDGTAAITLPAADTTYSFAFNPIASGSPTVALASSGNGITVSGAAKTALVMAAATNATEYGVLISYDEEAITAVTTATVAEIAATAESGSHDDTEVRKYKALASNNDGQFGISLEDATGDYFLDGVSYFVRAYAINGETAVLSAVAELH